MSISDSTIISNYALGSVSGTWTGIFASPPAVTLIYEILANNVNIKIGSFGAPLLTNASAPMTLSTLLPANIRPKNLVSIPIVLFSGSNSFGTFAIETTGAVTVSLNAFQNFPNATTVGLLPINISYSLN